MREVRGGGECVDLGFVLHTGLEDPTTAVSERSLQKQAQGRKKPSDVDITQSSICDPLQEQVFKYNCVNRDLDLCYGHRKSGVNLFVSFN